MNQVSEGQPSSIDEENLEAPVHHERARGEATWVRILWSPTTWSFSVLLLLCLIFTVFSPNNFFTIFNLRNIAIASSSFLVMAIGVTFVLSAGGLDLSVGSVLVLSGVFGVRVMMLIGGNGWPTVLVGLLACVGMGAVVGLINGMLSSLLRIPALVVTLGTNFSALGLAYVLSGGQDLRGVPDLLVNSIGIGLWLGIPVLVWIAAFVGLVGSLAYSVTRFGRYTQAIGSSEEAAIRAGIRVKAHLIKLWVLLPTAYQHRRAYHKYKRSQCGRPLLGQIGAFGYYLHRVHIQRWLQLDTGGIGHHLDGQPDLCRSCSHRPHSQPA